jgi:hypothetical protein
MVRMPVDLIAQIDDYAASVQAQIGIIDVNISRGMAIRELVKRGLQSVQAGSLPPHQPRPHLATVDEPEPMAAPAPPMTVQQAPEVLSPETAPRHQRGLPREKLQEIADERTTCQGLTIRAFAQRLYDKGIYRSKDNKPAEAGWLLRQLKKAQDEGLL